MKITVVGMWGGFPKNDEPCSGYLIEKDGFKVLIDCGSGIATSINKYTDFNELENIIISHNHYDHMSDIGVLMYSRLVNRIIKRTEKDLKIYEPEKAISSNLLEKVKYSSFCNYDRNSKLSIGPFTFTFFEMEHPVLTYAMRVTDGSKAFVYTADGVYKDGLAKFAEDVDLLITECSLYKETSGEKSGHMNTKDIIKLVENSQPKNIVLTHLPHYGNVQELKQDVIDSGYHKVRLAEAGLEITL